MEERPLDLSAEEDGDDEGELVSGEAVVLEVPEAGARVTNWRLLVAGAAALPLTCVERVARRGAALEVDARDGRRLLLSGPASALDSLRDRLRPPVPLERVFAFANPQLPGRPPSMELLATFGPGPLPAGMRVVLQPEFALCDTYPATLVVPAGVGDAELARVARFRSRGRLPVLSSGGGGRGTVLRCAQPLAGPAQRGCREDEVLLAAFVPLLLLDARPRAAALANAARGGGTERPGRYPGATVLFGDIANIHALRRDHRALVAAARAPGDAEWPAASNAWLRHVAALLEAANAVARHCGGAEAAPALVHCLPENGQLLTERGFLSLAAYEACGTSPPRVGAFCAALGAVVWERPARMVVNAVAGGQWLVEFVEEESGRLLLQVTPEHRVVVRCARSGGWTAVEARLLLASGQAAVMRGEGRDWRTRARRAGPAARRTWCATVSSGLLVARCAEGSPAVVTHNCSDGWDRTAQVSLALNYYSSSSSPSGVQPCCAAASSAAPDAGGVSAGGGAGVGAAGAPLCAAAGHWARG